MSLTSLTVFSLDKNLELSGFGECLAACAWSWSLVQHFLELSDPLRSSRNGLLWTKLCSSKIHFQVLTPSTLECDLIWRKSLTEIIKIKLDHVGGATMTCVLIRGRNSRDVHALRKTM